MEYSYKLNPAPHSATPLTAGAGQDIRYVCTACPARCKIKLASDDFDPKGCPCLQDLIGKKPRWVRCRKDSQKWLFIGSKSDVTPCKHKDVPRDPSWPEWVGVPCVDSSCPGRIDGECPFSFGKPLDQYRHLFESLDF